MKRKGDEIAEGVSEYGEGAPGGSTVQTISARSANTITRDFGKFCKGGAIFMSDGYYFRYSDAEIKSFILLQSLSSHLLKNVL